MLASAKLPPSALQSESDVRVSTGSGSRGRHPGSPAPLHARAALLVRLAVMACASRGEVTVRQSVPVLHCTGPGLN